MIELEKTTISDWLQSLHGKTVALEIPEHKLLLLGMLHYQPQGHDSSLLSPNLFGEPGYFSVQFRCEDVKEVVFAGACHPLIRLKGCDE